MHPIDPGILVLMALLTTGAMVFLRIVAKEKHRREKWLQLRLDEKIKELKKGQSSAETTDDTSVITLHPPDH